MSTTRAPRKLTIQPTMAWLLVFIPALSYFVATRLSSSGFRWGRTYSLGNPVAESIQFLDETCSTQKILNDVLYLSTSTSTNTCFERSLPLAYSLNLQFQGRGMQRIVDSTWRHDEELGRGYLLFSQSYGNGRIWRWEVGGGPIAIGRSLHLENSGCRSRTECEDASTSTPNDNNLGSGGIAIDFHHGSESDKYREGSLVVAEWGEARIIRMEEVNGARTPLLLTVPDLCGDGTSQRRIYQPRSLLYTPFGDLLVADTAPECQKAGIFRLSQAVQVPALESLAQSRAAHSWTVPQHNFSTDVLYQQHLKQIGAISLDPSWMNLLAAVTDNNGRVLLVRIPLVTEDEDDEEERQDKGNDEDSLQQKATERKLIQGVVDNKASIVMDLTEALGIAQAGSIAVTERGQVFVAYNSGVAILDTRAKKVLGILKTPRPPTSLTLGEDKFLYVFTDDALFRIPTRLGPVEVPTNLVVGKK